MISFTFYLDRSSETLSATNRLLCEQKGKHIFLSQGTILINVLFSFDEVKAKCPNVLITLLIEYAYDLSNEM